MVASPILDYCQLVLWIAISALSLAVLSRLFRNNAKRFCQNIPVIPNNSIWGYVDLLATSTKEICSERSILATVEKYGQLSQFHCFHQHVVLITDNKMATLALEKVHGQGFFNVSYATDCIGMQQGMTSIMMQPTDKRYTCLHACMHACMYQQHNSR